MSIKEKLQNMGGIILGLVLAFLMLSVGMIFVYGTTWLASYVQPIVDTLNQYSLGIAICVLFPLSYFRKMRSICMVGILISAIITGLNLWLASVLFVYTYWGGIGVFIGLVAGGVTIIPEAMLAAIIKGQWFDLIGFLIASVIFFMMMWFCGWLAENNQPKTQESNEDSF
jgi:hypothetical protein